MRRIECGELSSARTLFVGKVHDEQAMLQLGFSLAEKLQAGDLIVLTGPLGAGKTTFTRGLGSALGLLGKVTSPTFVIARTHKRTDPQLPALVHVDAYRLGSPAELDDLDIDFENSITVVEWGEGFTDGLTDNWLHVEIKRDHTGESETRDIEMTGFGVRWAGQ